MMKATPPSDPAAQAKATGVQTADASLSKLTFGAAQGDGQGRDAASPPPRRRVRVPQQTIVMLVVLSVSAGAIYGMRTLGMKAGIAMGIDPIEYSAPTQDRRQGYDRIMNDLARIQNPLDVTLGEFGKSPFMMQTTSVQVLVDPVAGPALTPEEIAAKEVRRKAEERQIELETKLTQVQLQSVMGGRRPLARVNGETYRVGDSINDVFIIKRIEHRSIILTADGTEFTLTLEVGPGTNKASPMKVGGPSRSGK